MRALKLVEHIQEPEITETQSWDSRLQMASFAPSGVPKLRELILELAVRGKLVTQNPRDEPANELLKRIKTSKDQRNKPLPEISEAKTPFDLPKGWEWAYIGQISHDWGQKTPDKNFTYIDVSAIDNSLGIIKEPYVLQAKDAPSRARKIVKEGTVIYSTIRPYLLNIAIIDKEIFPEPLASTAFAVVHPLDNISNRYLFWCLRSPFFIKHVEDVQMGIAYPAINDGKFFSSLIPIPPIAEQQRIVVKVDELMALCDKLEAQKKDAAAAHEALAKALLGTLTQSQTSAEFKKNWQRITKNFNNLFTTESSIDALKKTVLQLAVMGKLVPQNPKDEPAGELLKRIKIEKEKLIKAGKIKTGKHLSPITDAEKPYRLPPGWVWIRLDYLVTKIGAGSTPLGGKQAYVKEGVKFLRSQNVWDEGLYLEGVAKIPLETHKKMSGTHVQANDLLFNITGASIGRCAVVPSSFDTANVSQHVTIIRPIISDVLSFLHKVLISTHVQKTVMDVQVGVSREGLSIGKLSQFLIPFPPLDEQKRIVAKVDELMVLCDGLKERLIKFNAVHEQLASALVEKAVME